MFDCDHKNDPPERPKGDTPLDRLRALVAWLPPGSSIRTPARDGKVLYLRRDDLEYALREVDALAGIVDELRDVGWDLAP